MKIQPPFHFQENCHNPSILAHLDTALLEYSKEFCVPEIQGHCVILSADITFKKGFDQLRYEVSDKDLLSSSMCMHKKLVHFSSLHKNGVLLAGKGSTFQATSAI